jgi:hypothetical protein
MATTSDVAVGTAHGLDAAIARVHTADGGVVGGGFLVGPREVLTCAHVVARALGLRDGDPPAADAEVRLDFPLVAPGQTVTARVVAWQPVRDDDTGDVACLSLLGEVPTGVRPTRLVAVTEFWSHPFRVFGFP